jgi:hypothetical protein
VTKSPHLKETELGRQKYETGNELTDFQKPDQMEAVENSGSSGKTEVRKEEQDSKSLANSDWYISRMTSLP